MSVITIQNISKTYTSKEEGEVKALDNICLDVGKGELFGLIGPDGAGKTTLFRILTTLLLPDSGKAKVCGFDAVDDFQQIRNIVGYMPGRFSLYQDLSIEENLNFFAKVFNTSVDANYDMIKDIYVQIEPFRKRRAGKLSGGMKQKLALCCALVHKPEVLFLDEPTTGVDPVSRKEFWAMLQTLKQQGITVMVSTPYMDEAVLCDRVALIQEGKLMTIDTPVNISKSYNKPLYEIKSKNNYELLNVLRSMNEVQSCYMFGDTLHVALKEVENDFIKKFLLQFPTAQIGPIEAGIEDCFINLMQK